MSFVRVHFVDGPKKGISSSVIAVDGVPVPVVMMREPLKPIGEMFPSTKVGLDRDARERLVEYFTYPVCDLNDAWRRNRVIRWEASIVKPKS